MLDDIWVVIARYLDRANLYNFIQGLALPIRTRGRIYSRLAPSLNSTKLVPELVPHISVFRFVYESDKLNMDPLRDHIDHVWNNIQHLTLCEDTPCDRPFPTELRVLSIKGKFNQPISQLPPKVRTLHLDGMFNQPLGKLPPRLHLLHLAGMFNQRLGPIPANLRILHLGGEFNQPVGKLPPLEIFYISGKFNQMVDFPLIHKLYISGQFNQPIKQLPNCIYCLCIGGVFNQPLGKLPACLEELELSGMFNQPISTLPAKVRKFNVWAGFDKIVEYRNRNLETNYHMVRFIE